ncbi:cyclophilin-like fold protein [Streptomyces coeruleofuscus]|uniref:Cyclophilin-like domain-containing protein n=1 Tax=Streptomyces coeruleofuscus TaxID=66879 RepID=A0ABN3J5X4_9ACTN
MIASALRLRARAVPIAVVLLTVTACTDDPPAAAPSSTSSPSSPAAGTRQTAMAQEPTAPSDRNTAMTIRLTVHGQAVDATLNDSAAARDFAALLPLTLDLSDFHGKERVADLPRRLDTSGAPDAAEGKAGDLAYYAPWGNLAVYYRDGGSRDPGLVILGHLADGAAERFTTADHVTIEAVS